MRLLFVFVFLSSVAFGQSKVVDTAILIQGNWVYEKTSTTFNGVTSNIKVFDTWTMNFDGEKLIEFTDLMGTESTYEGTYKIERDSLFRDYSMVGLAIKEISQDKLVLHSLNLARIYFNRRKK